MGFVAGDLPPGDPAGFAQQPFSERIRIVTTHWVEYGFGAPKMVHTIYIVKLLVLYIGGGVTLATLTSGFGPLEIGSWWDEPVLYQKLLLWTVLLEMIGIAGSWGPLAGHFKPMTGGIRYWLRPGTIRLPPWPDRVPGTAGDTRRVGDVMLYAAVLIALIGALALPGAPAAGDLALGIDGGWVRPVLLYPVIAGLIVLGLRDKVIFLAARGEQYLPALVFFVVLPAVDMIVAAKLLIVSVWVGAGVSKIGRHFAMVVPPMISNTPWIPSKAVRRLFYRNFPDDLRPSGLATGVAHVLGTGVEIVVPLVLLFSTDPLVTLVGVAVMVAFHLFIVSTFPLAVPLEWNILFGYAAVFLFAGFPNQDGFAIADMSALWLPVLITAGLVFFPVLGNLRPDLVSFLPSMRQYAGNWAAATWAFVPGAEDTLDRRIPRPAPNTRTQLLDGYTPEVADMVLHQPLGFRALHSQGRALLSLMARHLGPDIDRYVLREAEFSCNSLVAFNFGDGHLHDERLIESIQRRCGYAPGEFLVAWIESQPIHKKTQRYKVIDAALGVIETGTYVVTDAIAEQPWLPNGPIAFAVEWALDGELPRAERAETQDPPMPAPPTAAEPPS